MSNSLQTHGLSMEFSRQEHWSGLPFLSPGDRPDSGIKPGPPAMQADSLPSELPGKPINKCINSFSSDNKYYESKGNRERRRENEDGACDIIQHSQRKVKVKVAQLCPTLCHPIDYNPGNYPDQNTGMGSLSLLQGVFLTQKLNQGKLNYRRILYQLSY